MGEHVLAIDQGTTATTAMVVDAAGRVRSRASAEFRQYYPHPGWVEHDAEDIWLVTRRVLRAALRQARLRPRDLAAVGIANQRETVVLWDRSTGRPLHRAIVWQDRRTAPLCRSLQAQGCEAAVRGKTGLVLDPYFSATKLRWLFDHVPRARARASRLAFGTIDAWLVWKLTGAQVHTTDFTNASRTLLFNIHTRRWDDELVRLFDVPPEVLPAVSPSAGVRGYTDGRAFGAGVPITGVAGDQQAALFGQACFRPGLVKNTLGTGCFLLMYTEADPGESRRGLLTTLACAADGRPAYALEGSVFVAGAAVQWLRDGLGLFRDVRDSERLARSVASTLGVYMVPAFVGLGTPYWDAAARGAIVGLTRGVTKAHVTRATLEALAYQTRDVIDAMAEGGQVPRGLRVDGGAAANDFLMQLHADVLGVPVDRPAIVETTAFGAALLAGVGAGLWTSAATLERLRRPDRIFRPRLAPEQREALYQGWRRAVAAVRTLGSAAS